MPVNDLLEGMDDDQKRAVTLETNGVIAAGAGSGKTRVLAKRYTWLIERGYKPEEILALTFTNKAVSEMYSRIYRYLLDQGEGAAEAVRNFHKARISTLDSFSAGVARTAASRYGISPDFQSADNALRELAGETALTFVLNHREDEAIRRLLVDHKIRILAEDVFSQAVIRYSPISSPLNLDKFLAAQREELARKWRETAGEISEITGTLIIALEELLSMKKNSQFIKKLEEIFAAGSPPHLPEIDSIFDSNADTDESAIVQQEIKNYLNFYYAIAQVNLSGNFGEAYQPILGYLKQLKGREGDGLYHEMESIANYALNIPLCAKLYSLIDKFQHEFNGKKREAGFLSFNDIAHLAVDTLKDHPDIRRSFKDNLRMIMVDEFQDNNALQRDLVYLLAEKTERTSKGLPDPEELENNRMFFVGDEKQSIYRFRGADVAVFRSLDLKQIDLSYNYRSMPGLVAAFNHIFTCVFKPCDDDGTLGIVMPAYEAEYRPVKARESVNEGESPGVKPLVHFCFLNKEELPEDDDEGIKSQDLEAVYIAQKIRKMEKEDEYCWGDFAVLMRTYTHQARLEKAFREFGIPYNTDRPSGLFNEAPVLDLRAYLRLLVYPEDRIAYAALIRSPFVRLSDISLAVCMLNRDSEPFAEENEEQIPENERELYRYARERYMALRDASRSLPITELITKLWYDEAYRYETLWTESVQVYEGLFDLFFSLASEAESQGKSFAEFIDYLDDVMKREVKPDDRDIPVEGESGVRILSIHKSKGLEFPVVFIFDCSNSGNTKTASSFLVFDEKFGLIPNLPQADEAPIGGNYFRRLFSEEEKDKNIAELKRLLYVAMTRAEKKLFLTFTMPGQTKDEKKSWNASQEEFSSETIRKRLIQLEDKTKNRDNFLKLLLSVLPDCPSSLCSLEIIPVLTRAEISMNAGGGKRKGAIRSQKEAAMAAASFYESAEELPAEEAGFSSFPASRLRFRPLDYETSAAITEDDDFDNLLKKAGIASNEFGTLVHAILECHLKGQEYKLPLKYRSEEKAMNTLTILAEQMAEGFLSSPLGERYKISGSKAMGSCREPEFPIVTSVTAEGRAIAITGTVDLLFEEENETVVVDFKTDRKETPENHYGQLAAYHQAAGDIFGKPVSVWLFYLRSGRAVDVTEEVRGVSLELCLKEALAANLAIGPDPDL